MLPAPVSYPAAGGRSSVAGPPRFCSVYRADARFAIVRGLSVPFHPDPPLCICCLFFDPVHFSPWQLNPAIDRQGAAGDVGVFGTGQKNNTPADFFRLP